MDVHDLAGRQPLASREQPETALCVAGQTMIEADPHIARPVLANERASSLSDDSPGEVRQVEHSLAGPFPPREAVVGREMVEIHTLPRESSNRRNTCGAASPSFVVYTARGVAVLSCAK